jgi:hypothetical protein
MGSKNSPDDVLEETCCKMFFSKVIRNVDSLRQLRVVFI